MRLLADENVPLPTLRVLRGAAHDVVAVAETRPGSSDRSVLAWANREHRLLVTFDRDFGGLVFRDGAPAHPGVIYVRFVPATLTEAGEVLAALIAGDAFRFDGFFTAVERMRVRQRRLPDATKFVRERSWMYNRGTASVAALSVASGSES